jgi:probable rRNA maturation factor
VSDRGGESPEPAWGPLPFSGRRRRRPDEGAVAVFLADEQSDLPVDTSRWGRLAEDVLRAEGIRGDAELSLLFVDEAHMAELNLRFMGADEPTDVLAFPLDDDHVEPGRWPDSGSSGPLPRAGDGDPPLLLGDVVVCPAVAARNADARGGRYEDEVALLVVHGLLHVLGMDHAEPDEAAAMQARERDLLARFHVGVEPAL